MIVLFFLYYKKDFSLDTKSWIWYTVKKGGVKMPRSEKQKQKLIRLLEIFIKDTDQTHGISMAEILEKLSSYGISAERKSIYDDIATLGELGFDIVILPEKPPKYTLAKRPFEFAELKMLVDAVETSKFITRERSKELIEKLRAYAGKSERAELRRLVYVEDRIKTENDFSVENIDHIHKAINANKRITFRYFDYTGDKKRIFRHDGKRYEVSPASLVLSDDNYYLVAYDADAKTNKNFRVDKMSDIIITEEKRDSEVTGERFNPAEYKRKVFGMYGGKEELVTLGFSEHLAGVIIDRFGKNETFFKTKEGFKVSVRVMLSPNFYGWVLGFGKDMQILSPEWVKKELFERLEEVKEAYGVQK